MARTQVIQELLDLFDKPAYLEVGVFTGATFHAVRADSKVAVDPNFKFDVSEWREKQPTNEYNSMPSDEYFATCPIDRKFHLIFLDGLHTFEQTFRDLVNSLSHIHAHSVIVVDDVFPSNYAASLPDRRESGQVRNFLGLNSSEWMGDVYRLVFLVETFFQSWDYRCVDDTNGQMVMWQNPRRSVVRRNVESIARAEYARAITDRKAFRFSALPQIVAEIRSSRLMPDALVSGR